MPMKEYRHVITLEITTFNSDNKEIDDMIKEYLGFFLDVKILRHKKSNAK